MNEKSHNCNEIEALRREIDETHQQIFELIFRRLYLSEKIWRLKKQHALPWNDLEREQFLTQGLILQRNQVKNLGNLPSDSQQMKDAKALYQQVSQILISEGKKILKERVIRSEQIHESES